MFLTGSYMSFAVEHQSRVLRFQWVIAVGSGLLALTMLAAPVQHRRFRSCTSSLGSQTAVCLRPV